MKEKSSEKIRKINCTANELDMLYHQAARKLNVSDSVLCILYLIYEKGDGCLLSDICHESGMSKQTINSAIRTLEKNGILHLERSDGRAKRIKLSKEGERCIERTAAKLYKAECVALDSWSDEEFDMYIKYMKKYNECLRVQIDKIEVEK